MSQSHTTTDHSRRRFLALAGSAAGCAALAATGMFATTAECSPNIPEIDADDIPTTTHQTDVLVVGSGIAGVFAAVKAHDAGARVLMVSKGCVGRSGQTPFGRGVFAFDPAKESMDLDEYVDAVSRSAMGTNNPIFTRQTAAHSLARVKELKSWGFFKSNKYADAFAMPLEEREIPVMERVMLTHLIKEDGKAVGAAGFSIDEGTVHIFEAKSIILCTGAGGFKPNGFPICDLTHDGSVMAYRIGAKITGKEWNDGHRGNLENPAAVYDQWAHNFNSKPSFAGVGIRHDLGVDGNYKTYVEGPAQSADSGDPFGMETTAIAGGPYRPAGFDKAGPPQDAEGRSGRPGPPPHGGGRDGHSGPPPNGGGRDGHSGPPPRDGEKGERHGPPGMGGVPAGGASAGMSIHKAEGLVPYDEHGASNIPGLYAAGDALGSHMCGGIYTQIGSSMAGSAVQGGIAGEAAARYSSGISMPTIRSGKKEQVREDILAPLKMERGYSPAWVTQTLQGIMIPNFVLYIKKAPMMQAALAYVEELRDHHTPMLIARDLHELRLAHETANMIINAEMKMRASLMRTESRCSHYRLDYPEVDTKNWNAWINIHQGTDGAMELEKQPFGTWPS